MISIITPTYNRARFLSKMISSIRNQTFTDWELLIMDDASRDDSRQVVESFKDKRIRYFYSSENEGAGKQRNKGAEKAKGDYLIFLDSDDVVLPNWLQEFHKSMSNAPAEIFCCGYERLNSNGEILSRVLPECLGEFFNNISANFLAGTIMFQKDLFHQIGGYDDKLPSGQHTDLFLRILDAKGIKGIAVNIIEKYLIHIYDHQNSKIRNNFGAVYEGTLMLLEKHKVRFLKNKKTQFKYWTIAGVSAARNNELKKSKRCFWAAFKLFPLDIRNLSRLIAVEIPVAANIIWKVQ